MISRRAAIIAVVLAVVLANLAAAVLGARWLLQQADATGYARGLAEGKAKCQQADLDRLAGVLDSIPALTEAAHQASRQIEASIAARRQADQKTTEDLRHALAITAPARTGCVFDDAVVRALAAARERAARAAAGGLSAGVRDAQ